VVIGFFGDFGGLFLVWGFLGFVLWGFFWGLLFVVLGCFLSWFFWGFGVSSVFFSFAPVFFPASFYFCPQLHLLPFWPRFLSFRSFSSRFSGELSIPFTL